MRFGEMETEASPDWQFPELGVPGAGGRAGVRGGQLCRQERGGPAAAASAWPVPSSPARASAPASCFSSDRAPSAGKVETPRAPGRRQPYPHEQEGRGSQEGTPRGLG